jgi:hypothetical protein
VDAHPIARNVFAAYDSWMLPRLPRNLRIALLVIFVCCAPQLKAAASAERGKGPGGPHLLLSGQSDTGIPLTSIRYHFGDDPHWANPGFDDQSWPIAEQVRWPVPAFNSDGFMWARARVTVRSDAAGPIALCLSQNTLAIADEVFVNGKEVGRQGSPPPHIEISLFPQDAVFDLPADVAAPGTNLVVAFRVWYPPFIRTFGWFDGAGFILDGSRNLRLAVNANRATTLLKWGPTLALNILIGVMGLGLLAFWRWTRTREILLCSAMLIAYPVFQLFHDLGVLGLLDLSFQLNTFIYFLLQAAGMAITVEFTWEVHGLRAPSLKRLAQVALVVFNLCGLDGQLATTPSTIARLSTPAVMLAAAAFNVVILAVNLWALFNRRRTRLIAAALALIPIASSMLWLGGAFGGTFGVIHIEYLDLAFFVSALALFIMLGQSGWQAWRARDELRVEFEAAREVQERLVAPAVDVPGFKIESVYAPAKQVGGDFFRVLPAADGSLLVVVGDVSGKGLKAAMTVSAIMGALPGCPSRMPAQVLAHLNQALYGQVGGFVTCCAAFIATDGAMTFANAGNPAPYRNGEVMLVEPGLPLGMLAYASYRETHYQIAPGDRLTFVSDGVVEATNPQGELYGFERTLAVSNQPANTIAEAARQFGQEDDITVLSLTRTVGLNPALT